MNKKKKKHFKSTLEIALEIQQRSKSLKIISLKGYFKTIINFCELFVCQAF